MSESRKCVSLCKNLINHLVNKNVLQVYLLSLCSVTVNVPCNNPISSFIKVFALLVFHLFSRLFLFDMLSCWHLTLSSAYISVVCVRVFYVCVVLCYLFFAHSCDHFWPLFSCFFPARWLTQRTAAGQTTHLLAYT